MAFEYLAPPLQAERTPTYLDRVMRMLQNQFEDIDENIVLFTNMHSSITVTGTSHLAGAAHIILVDDDTAGAPVTVTLPAAATVTTPYHVKKLGTTDNVIIDADGAETLDGALTITLAAQYASVMLVSDGAAWHVMADR